MGKVTNLVIGPDSTYRIRPVVTKGKVFLSTRDKEALIADPDAVSINPSPIPFSSWDDFIKAPEPEHLRPRDVSPIAALLMGDSPWLVVSSEVNPWTQQRKAGRRDYGILSAQWDEARDEAFASNAIGPAGRTDSGNLPTMGILASTIVIMVSVLLFAIIIIQERFMS